MKNKDWPIAIVLFVVGFFGMSFITDKWIESNTKAIDVHKVFNEQMQKTELRFKELRSSAKSEPEPVIKFIKGRDLRDCMKEYGGNEINNAVVECTKDHWVKIGYEVK